MVGVGRDLCGSSSPTLLPKKGHLQQAAQELVQEGLEYLQRRRPHNLPGQPVPGLRHPQREEVLPHVQTELPLLQFVPVAPCPVAGHHWKEFGPISVHRYIKLLLCLKHLPTEQIEIRLLEPHSNKEHPSQNQHKTTNKKQLSVPKAAWNQEEAKAFYLAKMKTKKFWCSCQKGVRFRATELWKDRTACPELLSPTPTASAPQHSLAGQHRLLASRSEKSLWCQRNIATKSPGRNNIRSSVQEKLLSPPASHSCRIPNI